MARLARYRLLLSVILLGMLTGCWRMVPPGVSGDVLRYQVARGETLYSISWRYGYDYREVAAWNNIPPPYTLYPGDELILFVPYGTEPRQRPATAVDQRQAATAPAVVASAAPTPRTISAPARAVVRSPRVEKTPQRLHQGKVSWRWPSEGSIAAGFEPANGKKGLDIRGKLGQSVLAAASGEVVYSGSGLIGYGNLIIIKHSDVYLSAYGHNRLLLVKEGEKVKQGEKIAEMGDSGKDGVILHFEIRRDGKPVNPLPYLPKRRN